MPQSCHGAVRVAVAAAAAGMGGVALFRAGRLGYNVSVVMAQRLYNIVHIAFATTLAGVGGVAILGAGRLGHNCVIAVAQCRSRLGIGVAAGCADISRHAAARTGSLADGCLVGMARSRNRLGIAVTAAGASVGLCTVLGAGCRFHRLLISMSKGCGGIRCVAVAASGAGVGGIPFLGAGGCCHRSCIGVTGCRNRLGIGILAGVAAIGDAARLGAGGCRLADLLIAMHMVSLNRNHILGAVYHISGCTGRYTGEGQLRIGQRTGPDRAGGCRPGKGAAVIAAPGNLRQLPPIAPCRGNHHLDVAEALHGFRYLIGLGHRSASAAGIGADGRPVFPVGGNLNVCVGAVVSMGRGRNLNGVEPHLSAQIHPRIHANLLAVAGPVIGGRIAVNEVGCNAVVAADCIAGNRSGYRCRIRNLSASSLNIVEICLCNGGITGMGDGLLALQRIGIGGLADLQCNILSGQQLRIGIPAARAGIDGIAVVIRSRIIVAQCRHRFRIAVAAVGAGIGHAAGFCAGGCLSCRYLIVVYLCRRIGVQRAVCIEAARYYRLIHAAGIIAVHGKAHRTKRQADLLCLLRLRLSAGIIAPHAEHSADYSAAVQGIAANLIVAPVGSIGIAAVKIIALTQYVIEVASGVDNLEAVAGQVGCRTRIIAAPAAGPVAYYDILVKGIGLRTNGSAGLVCKLNAVIECNGRHASIFDHRSKLVDILNKVAVLIAALEAAEAHAAAGIAVIGIFIGAEVEVLAALACKVIDVLLDKRLGECHSRGVRHVNGTDGAVVAAGHSRQGRCRIQNRVHMSGAVEQGDDLNPSGIGRGKDFVHLTFGPLAGGIGGITGVTRLNCRFYCIAGIGGSVDSQRHVIQQEPHSVVSYRQHDMGIPVRLCFINERLDPIHSKVLSSAVQHGDLHIVPAGRSERRCREHANQHANGQQQR